MTIVTNIRSFDCRNLVEHFPTSSKQIDLFPPRENCIAIWLWKSPNRFQIYVGPFQARLLQVVHHQMVNLVVISYLWICTSPNIHATALVRHR